MATNNPPVLRTAYPDWATSVGHTLRAPIGTNFSDPDGDPLSYSATLENGEPLPAWLTFDPSRTMLNGTPSASDVGIFNITLRATDPSGASVTDTVTLTVNPVFEGSMQTQVNTVPVSAPPQPKIAALPSGGYVVAWTGTENSPTPTDVSDIYVRAFGANNQPITQELILSTTTRLQGNPQVTAFADGSWLVTWLGLPADGPEYILSAQRFDAAGNQSGPEIYLNGSLAGKSSPVITTLASGGYAITWGEISSNTNPAYGWDIYAQIFDNQGNASSSKLVVNTVRQLDQNNPAIASLKDGGFAIAWDSNAQDGSELGVFLQRYSANGDKVGPEIQANTTTIGAQRFTDVTSLSDGGFVVSWYDSPLNSSDQNPFFQRFDSAGQKIGSEIRANSTTINLQKQPQITATMDGGWIVAWHSSQERGGSDDIFAQRYSANGIPIGQEARINTDSAISTGFNPFDLKLLADGQVAAVWQDGTQIFSRTLALANDSPLLASPLSDVTVTQNTLVNIAIPAGTFTDTDELTLSATLADGSPLPSWLTFNPSTATLSGTAPAGFDLPPLSIQVTARDTAGGTATDTFTLTLTAASATPGDDVLYGTAQDDAIDGLAGNDQILGGSGNDTLAGGAGTDTLTGGTGTDRFDFRVADGGGDRIADFETGETLRIEGAPASTEQYRLRTSGPDTVLDIDTDGVGDFDLSLTLAGNANGIVNVTADPTSATAQLVTITPANASYGSQNSDVLTAGSFQATPQTVFGLRGDDLVNTGTGDDLLDGGSGNDRLFGNSGRDTLLGGSGDDLLAGQFDADVLTGGAGVDQYFFSIFDANGDHITDYQYGEKIGLYFAPTDASRYTLVRNGSQSSLGIDTTGDGQADVSIRLPDNLNGTVNLSQEVLGGDTVQIVTLTPVAPPANRDPVAAVDSASTLRNTGVTVAVRTNDSDPDGDTLTVTAVTAGSANGQVSIDPVSGNPRYTPVSNFVGTDQFTYTVSDGRGGSASTSVTVRVATQIGTDNADTLNGTTGANFIVGLSGADQINALGGSDTVEADDGNDTLVGGAGADQLHGGAGDDTFLVTGSDLTGDTVRGGAGSDTLRLSGHTTLGATGFAMSEVETLDMAGFSFTVQTSQTLDLSGLTVVNGGLIQGHAGANALVGTAGADLMHGGGEADLVRGGAGNDTLSGGAGRDTVEGGEGEDILRLSGSDPTGDVLDGGAGTDTLQLISHTTLGTAGMTLSGLEVFDMGRFNLNVQTSTLVDLSGLELVNAGAISGDGRANTIHGARGNDTIRGGGESDLLRGGLGNDSLSGDGGNDTLSGGLGNDWLQGGTGADLFVFDVTPNASHADTIAGFSANAADRIAFDPTLFGAIASQGSSALDASEFRTTVGGNAVDADDFVVYDPVTGGLYYDADGSGAAAKVLVATLSGLTGTLDHQDFVMAAPGGF